MKKISYSNHSIYRKRTVLIAHAFPIVCAGLREMVSAMGVSDAIIKQASSLGELCLLSQHKNLNEHYFYIVDYQLIGEYGVTGFIRDFAVHDHVHFLFMTNNDVQLLERQTISEADCTYISQNDRNVKHKMCFWLQDRMKYLSE